MRKLSILAMVISLAAMGGCSQISPGTKADQNGLTYTLMADRTVARLVSRPGNFGNRVNFDLDVTNTSNKDYDGHTTDSAYFRLTIWQNGKKIWDGPTEAAQIAIPVHIPANKKYQVTWPVTWEIDPTTVVDGNIKAVATFEPTGGTASIELPVVTTTPQPPQ